MFASSLYLKVQRQHDPLILLAWAGMLAGLLLHIFYRTPGNRQLSINIHDVYSCTGALPCQTVWDFAIIFTIALGAGLLIWKEQLAIAGFAIAHVLATGLFILSIIFPVLLGITGPLLSVPMVNLAIVTAFALQFPIAIILSLLGALSGIFFSGRLGLSEVD